MKQKTFGQQAADVTIEHKPELLDWGIRYLVPDERTALLVGYSYRYSKHGYTIAWCPNVSKFSVTIWNDRAKKLGFSPQ